MVKKYYKYLLAAALLFTLLIVSCGGNETTYSVTFVSDGVTVSQISVKENQSATYYLPKKTGYTFVCWNLNGQKYNFSTPVTSDIILTAEWKKNKVKVKYTSLAPLQEGSSVPTDSTIYEYGDTVTVQSSSITSLNAGTFYGWSKEPNKHLQTDAITEFTIEENTTLYAVWQYNVSSIPCTVYSSFMDELKLSTQLYFDPQMFIGKSNSTFNLDIAKFAILLAGDAFSKSKVVITGLESESKSMTDSTGIYKALGFSDVTEKYSAAEETKDPNDIAGYIISHSEYGDTSLIILAIKGPDNTFSQWKSSCDFGANTDDYFATEGIEKTETNWTATSTIHKGYEVTANRLKTEVDSYISEKTPATSKKIMLITGQSRGGSIANLLGSMYEDAYVDENTSVKTFTYTFACPPVTTAAKNAKTIFNIINEDDIMAAVPTFFKINGTTYSYDYSTFEANYADRVYKGDTKNSYKPLKLQESQKKLLTAMANVASSREALYTYESDFTPFTLSTNNFTNLEGLGIAKYLKHEAGLVSGEKITAVMPAFVYQIIPMIAANVNNLKVDTVMPIITLMTSLNSAGKTKYMDIIECVTGDFSNYTTKDYYTIIAYMIAGNYESLLSSLKGVNNPYGVAYAHDPITYMVLIDSITQK